MTVTQLTERLLELAKFGHGDDIVRIWDPDAEEWLPVTGMTYGGQVNVVDLYSDIP